VNRVRDLVEKVAPLANPGILVEHVSERTPKWNLGCTEKTALITGANRGIGAGDSRGWPRKA